ncbi:hypothetical protein [Flavobacterium sp.]|uniref:hypothetical protein n=1 Tax=Flavobacterium sp. TaxID=239 RepID=UPI00260C05A1|nr:hypothetical protein [Flavobacterium sp.]
MKEIYMFEVIKRCYIHFLCTQNVGDSVENTTYMLANKEIIKHSLRDLYQKLDAIKRKEGLVSNTTPSRRRQHSADFEAKAIMLFNKDYRFTITE